MILVINSHQVVRLLLEMTSGLSSELRWFTVGGREKGSRTRVVYITTLVVSQYDMCHNDELHSSSSDVALNSFQIWVVF